MDTAIQSLVKFCTDTNVSAGDPKDQSLLKTLICNTQFVDRPALFAELFGADSYINWDVIANMEKRVQSRNKRDRASTNAVGSISTWHTLLSFVHGHRPAFLAQTAAAKMAYRPFYLVHEAIATELRNSPYAQADAAGGRKVDLSISVRIFFIINLIGIQPTSAIESVLGRLLDRPVRAESQAILIQLACEKFTQQQYSAAIAWLVTTGIVVVDSAALCDEIFFHRKRDSSAKDMMKMYTIQVQKSGRPSLFQIAKNAQSKTGKFAHSIEGDTYDNYYTFTGFTYRMRFPSSLSTYMQQRAYWLASQREFFQWRYVCPGHPFNHTSILPVVLNSLTTRSVTQLGTNHLS